MRGQKIFTAFLIIIASTVMFMLPYFDAAEALKVDTQTDYFSLETAVGQSTDNVVFSKALYDDDTTSILVVSDLSTEGITWGSYNGTAQHLLISNMTENTTRTLTATYDIDALQNDAVANFVDALVWVWLLSAGAFAPTALAAIWVGRI